MEYKTDSELLDIMTNRMSSSYDQLDACRELEGREMRAYKGYGRKTLELKSESELQAIINNCEIDFDCRIHAEKEYLRRSGVGEMVG